MLLLIFSLLSPCPVFLHFDAPYAIFRFAMPSEHHEYAPKDAGAMLF